MNIDERAHRAGTKLREHADGLDADALYERVTAGRGPGRRARSRVRAVAVGTVVLALLAGLAVIVYPMIAGNDATAPFVEPSGPTGSGPPAEDPADVPHGRFDAADARGRTTLVALDAVPEGVTPGFAAGLPVFYVRDGDDVEVLVDDPQHLDGEALWWCPEERVFVSPAHGELFDANGKALAGPIGRGLDRFLPGPAVDGFLPIAGDRFGEGFLASTGEPAGVGTALGPAAQEAYENPPWAGRFCRGHVPAEARDGGADGAAAAPLPVPDGFVEHGAPWGLRAPVDAGTSRLEIEVHGGGCHFGVNFVSHVSVREMGSEVVVEAVIREPATLPGEQDVPENEREVVCPLIGEMLPVTVPLSSPLRDRELVDPACADLDQRAACPDDKRDTAPAVSPPTSTGVLGRMTRI